MAAGETDDEFALSVTEHRNALAASNRGQMVFTLRDCAPLSGASTRAWFYVQIVRRRSVEPVDVVGDDEHKARVGEFDTEDEHLHWVTRYADGFTRGLYVNERFHVNVDDIVRDALVIRVLESTLLGAKCNVVAERVVSCASVLPQAMREQERTMREEKVEKLRALLLDYSTLYAKNSIEHRKMERDIEALTAEIKLLADDQRLDAQSPQTISLRDVKFLSTEMSAPSNAKHSLHVAAGSSSNAVGMNNFRVWRANHRNQETLSKSTNRSSSRPICRTHPLSTESATEFVNKPSNLLISYQIFYQTCY